MVWVKDSVCVKKLFSGRLSGQVESRSRDFAESQDTSHFEEKGGHNKSDIHNDAYPPEGESNSQVERKNQQQDRCANHPENAEAFSHRC